MHQTQMLVNYSYHNYLFYIYCWTRKRTLTVKPALPHSAWIACMVLTCDCHAVFFHSSMFLACSCFVSNMVPGLFKFWLGKAKGLVSSVIIKKGWYWNHQKSVCFYHTYAWAMWLRSTYLNRPWTNLIVSGSSWKWYDI